MVYSMNCCYLIFLYGIACRNPNKFDFETDVSDDVSLEDCEDAIDNDGDGDIDCDDEDCEDRSSCVVTESLEDTAVADPEDCNDGIDNDNDGAIDCEDDDCSTSMDCSSQSSVGSETHPGMDCLDILTKGGSSGDGLYWVDPTGADSFQVYCDMTTDGGGWTLIMNEDDVDTATVGSSHWYSPDVEGVSKSFDTVRIQRDMMFDVADDVVSVSPEIRTIVIGVHKTAIGLTLYEAFNSPTPVFIEAEDNSNVFSTVYNDFDCADVGETPYHVLNIHWNNWGLGICPNGVITLSDRNVANYQHTLGLSRSYSQEWNNWGGWPENLYGGSETNQLYPNYYRIWIR